MSYEALRDTELAAVVTFLEMRQRAQIDSPPSDLSLRRVEAPNASDYRRLFRMVGAPWLWFSRLIMDDADLEAIIGDPRVELFEVIARTDQVIGMLELDLREAEACELAFVGLVPEWSGKGHGRWLLAEAVSKAWREGVKRVHVHTCSLDHPAALGAYRRAGFTAYKRAIERFTDPRVLGVLPLDCAPQIPVLGTVAST